MKTLAATVALTAALVVVPAPAAHANNSALSHREDAGYDPTIILECDSGRREYLAEGQRSWAPDKCPGGVAAIWLRTGEDLVCMWWDAYGWNWRTLMRDPGRHPVGEYFAEHNAGCVLKVDQ